ncbi:preprotein translocase subunit SecA [Immundisolibacter cernigliae]|uniref:Protein translocase subunit SecA n=1 Tax=Immundisolibacter cernigliae TaxID=1810504 RepID=A0A1B1YUY7_9GAMM|nr:preprotein translocase subunit SecA [Immundisolibacter cernigliae]ANX04539.1 preprotein translocase subunit SecA [Immundisolibacter cernigliae]
MLQSLVRRIVGSRNQREVKRYFKSVGRINALAPQFEALTDAQLRQWTDTLKQRHANGETLDQLLPEAFALVREAAGRVLGMRHFDVQLVGGMVLHEGKIAEMRTGEGKTLVATLPAYLNALAGKGVHVVTVNDYLARRDGGWMGRVYEFLGLSTGIIVSNLDQAARQAAYAADITYGTNNEFGFDYLRDNMAFTAADRVQRRSYGIVDEVDSILIDEARTPLIISGPSEGSTELYAKVNVLIPRLTRQTETDGPGDYHVDEKTRQVLLTDAGHEHAEELLAQAGLLGEGESLYDAANITLMHHLNASLRAHTLFQRDVHYVVNNGEVIIVDEFTGRLMPGRRWSEGLHQAVEAKEKVPVKQENQTLATITFQNYFRLYDKLSGMTGTADTEAFELHSIYGLEVVVIPTHRPMVRKDHGDQVFLTVDEKYDAVLADITDCHGRGQPVLVGTASIETSELVSARLKKANIPHQVLNAKYHEQEAQIIAAAGEVGAVTIATNMAGRGTDIVLGGNLEARLHGVEDPAERERIRSDWQAQHDKVVELGGLHVAGTERNESRRVDNQLRGRSGRQGDPGSSRFYLSLQDDLMRIFASDRVSGWMQKLGLEPGEAIEHRWVTRAIENAQKKVEGRNFDMRKQLLEYDDIANEQRKLIYQQRNELLEADDVSGTVLAMVGDVVGATVDRYLPPGSVEEQWDLAGLKEALHDELGSACDPLELASEPDMDATALRARLVEIIEAELAQKQSRVEPAVMRHFEKAVMLQVLDSHWKDHLAAMDHLRHSIHLRGYAQKNPKQEYKREAFTLFTQMLDRVKTDVATTLLRVQVRAEEDVEAVERQRRPAGEYDYQHAPAGALEGEAQAEEADVALAQRPSAAPFVRGMPKVGRNEPCPCGSGKKFKQCHGQLQ